MVIKSVCYSDSEVLQAILDLHVQSNQFELDPTYSKGIFWKNIPEPKYKYDISPINDSIKQSDCRDLPFETGSIRSVCFDPPFMFGTHGQTKNNLMNKRFTMFDSWQELVDMYTQSITEFYRILTKKGILAFKCQDYTDSKTTMTHCYVWQWAIEKGFYAKDLFVLIQTGGRIYNPNLIQRHSRKYHSYWFVFQK